jgi:hypothetical protein
MKAKINYLDLELPEKTKTYQPVGHKELLDFCHERLDVAGFKVTTTNVDQSDNGSIIIANMQIEREENNAFTQQFTAVNSYFKEKPIMFASGGHVFVCQNGMIVSEALTVRRHTTNVWHELTGKADTAILQMTQNWEKTLADAEAMREREMTITNMSRALGQLYVEMQLLAPTEVNIAAREIRKPTFEDFKDHTLWSFYNHCTYALKGAHTYRKNECLKGVHDFCMELV